jgi:hypothetical protein
MRALFALVLTMRARRRCPRLIYGAAAVVLVLALVPFAAAWAQEGSLERAIKATYLYKFVPFVEWPKTVWSAPTSPLVLCVAGDDPFGQVLDEAVAGQAAGPHPIALRRLSIVTRESGCNLLYDAGSPAQTVADALAAVRGTPVLTVTDAERNGGAKGIINFVILGNHVRFEIDDAAAAENGLVISSKLLSLAVHVTPRR